MMNIFIDTNILYEDYFFNNKSNRKILEYARAKSICLYMSDIVRLELRKQFENEIIEKNKEIKTLLKDIKRLRIQNNTKDNIQEIDINNQLEEFDNFYKYLSERVNFKLLPYKNEFLPVLVDRAINRKKPFSENKTELKDAIIWMSYSDYVEDYGLTDCILLTNNTSDFCDKHDKSKIHKDLEADTDKFEVINNSFDLIKIKGPSIETPEHKFQLYISEIEFDDEFILNLIKINFIKDLKDYVYNKIEQLHPIDVLKKDYPIDGQMMGYDLNIIRCEDINVEVLTNTALISGILYAECETEILQYNPDRDIGEDSFSRISDRSITFRIYFNFDFSEGELCEDFEITDIAITEVY